MCSSLRANWLTREGVTVKARLDVGIQMRHEVAENLVVDFVGGVCLLECLVGAEVANRGIESRDVEQRWQEQQEDEIRRQLDVREARHEPDKQSAQHQHNWVRR